MTTGLTREEQARIIAMAEARGNRPSDFRDAVHEMCHVLDTRLEDSEDWGREVIHARIMRREPPSQFRLECQARAAESVACKLAGIDYNLEQWALISALESLKARPDVVPTELNSRGEAGAWAFGINLSIQNGEGAKLLERVRELCSRS